MTVPVLMYDSVTIGNIPANATAVAGYVNGNWKTFDSLVEAFPRAHKLSIAVTAVADAECLDVERGDALPTEAPSWVRRQVRRGVKKPVVYTSVSNAKALVDILARSGIKRKQYRLWTAHYTQKAHLCTSRCGFNFSGKADATQYGNTPGLDTSFLAKDFFPKPPKPKRRFVPRWRWLRFGKI